METVKLVAGTDIRDGVEVEIEINAGGYRPLVDFIKNALRDYVDESAEVTSLDFVEEVSTFDIPEEGSISDYVVCE